jgi:hypothetical protein
VTCDKSEEGIRGVTTSEYFLFRYMKFTSGTFHKFLHAAILGFGKPWGWQLGCSASLVSQVPVKHF